MALLRSGGGGTEPLPVQVLPVTHMCVLQMYVPYMGIMTESSSSSASSSSFSDSLFDELLDEETEQVVVQTIVAESAEDKQPTSRGWQPGRAPNIESSFAAASH